MADVLPGSAATSDQHATPAHVVSVLPDGACCRRCDYLLHGLPDQRCSECGRGFDPRDRKSYAQVPRSWRRRRWWLRGAAALFLAAGGYGFFPRGVAVSSLTLTCEYCGHVTEARRWDVLAPKWVSIRYFGRTSRTDRPPVNSNGEHDPCSHGWTSLKVRADPRHNVWVTQRKSLHAPPLTLVNGLDVTWGNAAQVLESACLAPATPRPGFIASLFNVQLPSIRLNSSNK